MSTDAKTMPEDATEALLDKMSKDSFPASDPPSAIGSTKDVEKLDQKLPAPAGVTQIELGEEVEGDFRDTTLVFQGRDAAILHVVAEGRRLQIALPCNPLEVCPDDLDALIAALSRARKKLRT